jgi:ribonuclease T2
MPRIVMRLAASAALFLSIFSAAIAQDTRPQATGQTGGVPGQFDFYVLALSWSPSFCAAASEQGGNRGPSPQCDERPYSFVVHGLWPQYERGFPRNCQVPAPRLNRAIVDSMLDLMPAPQLVFTEWDRHGTCAGLDARAYFDTVRRARKAIKIPDRFVALKDTASVRPGEVLDAFIAANPGLPQNAIAVTCDSTRLREVRVCFSKDLHFRDCTEVSRRSCRRDMVLMPPVRGG